MIFPSEYIMDKRQDIATEYATQFFKFVPQSLIDDINEGTNELVQEALLAIKKKITAKHLGKVEPNVIEASLQKVEDKYLLEFDKIFEKLGQWSTAHVLRVPGNVLLEEDAVWDTEAPSTIASKLANINVEMEALRSKIKTAIYKKEVLTQSLESVEEICAKQEAKIQADEELFRQFNVSDWADMLDFTRQNKASVNSKMELLEALTDAEGEEEGRELSLMSKNMKLKIDKNCESFLDKLETMT